MSRVILTCLPGSVAACMNACSLSLSAVPWKHDRPLAVQALMREHMRNTDRAVSNIESHPEGFNALRRMYENIEVRSRCRKHCANINLLPSHARDYCKAPHCSCMGSAVWRWRASHNLKREPPCRSPFEMRPLRRQHPQPQAGLPTPLPLCLATWAAPRWLQGQPHRVLPALLPPQRQQSPTLTRCLTPGRPQLRLAHLQQVRSACYASCSCLLRVYSTAS